MNNFQMRIRQTFKNLISSGKVLLLLFACAGGAGSSAAQTGNVGKLHQWTLSKVSSREKDDEILPVSYKMRVSKNEGFDRIVFEFKEQEVPEYTIHYTTPPITLDINHLENPKRPAKDEIIKVEGKAFVLICFALGFDGQNTGAKFPGGENFLSVRDVKPVDWSENFFSFAVGLNEKKAFRVSELSHPTRLVVDFKH